MNTEATADSVADAIAELLGIEPEDVATDGQKRLSLTVDQAARLVALATRIGTRFPTTRGQGCRHPNCDSSASSIAVEFSEFLQW